MKVEKKDLKKSQAELLVELSLEEFGPYVKKGAEAVAKEVKIDGFRKGNVPYEILRQKIGDMAIIEEGARIAINKLLEKIIKENVSEQIVGQPMIDITKLAPENPLEFKIVLSLIPEVTLTSYKELKLKAKKSIIDEKEVERTLNELKEMRVQEVLVERVAQKDDKVLLDIKIFQDNVPLESGQGKNTVVIVGKDYIIPGFDKEVSGLKKGDEKEFSLPYPSDHHMKNLAGKIVDFKIKILDVYERNLPELDDVFAEQFGLKSFSELKGNIEKSIKDQKEKELKISAEKEMFDKLLEKTKFGDFPEVLIQHELETMINELKHSVVENGAKFEDYLKSLNKTQEQIMLDLAPDALKRVKVSLMIRAISVAEKIQASDESVQKYIDDVKKQYHAHKDVLAKINTTQYRDYVANILTSQKVVEALSSWNIESDK
jgi:trigger factor